MALSMTPLAVPLLLVPQEVPGQGGSGVDASCGIGCADSRHQIRRLQCKQAILSVRFQSRLPLQHKLAAIQCNPATAAISILQKLMPEAKEAATAIEKTKVFITDDLLQTLISRPNPEGHTIGNTIAQLPSSSCSVDSSGSGKSFSIPRSAVSRITSTSSLQSTYRQRTSRQKLCGTGPRNSIK